LLDELNLESQAAIVGRLAEETTDQPLRVALRLREADLSMMRTVSDRPARIGWELYTQKQLPADRIPWLLDRLSASQDHANLIQLAAEQLRAGKSLTPARLDRLATAYAAAGRPVQSLRARTAAQEAKKSALRR
jgi:hypothetical protein